MARPKKDLLGELTGGLVKLELSQDDRELEILMSAINKDFGGGSIHRVSDETISPVPKTSCGSIKIDHILGGGFGDGRIIELIAPSSCGKCLTADTFIRSTQGWQTVQELFNENGLETFCVTRQTPKEVPLINRYGKAELTKNFTHNGRRPLTQITSFSGSSVKSTSHHPHLILSKNGYKVWKKASEIEAGDYLVSDRSSEFFGDLSLDADRAYFYGVLIADSCFDDTRIGVTNDDPFVKELILSEGPKVFGKEPKVYDNNDKGSINFHFNTKEMVTGLYSELKWKPGIAKDKNFGPVLRKADKETMRSIVQGYVDCECWLDSERRMLEVASASQVLLIELKLILQQFGIIAILRDKTVSAYPDNDYYRLTWAGQELVKYNEIIGFRSESRKNEYAQFIPASQLRTNFDSIPNVGRLLEDLFASTETFEADTKLTGDYSGETPKANLTYTRLARVIDSMEGRGDPEILNRLKAFQSEHLFYDRVETVDSLPAEPTFDFEMSETHSFQANGFITHNTTLALHAIAAQQALGRRCAIVDAEHALDLVYAGKLGVQSDKLFLSQPDTGEEGLEITDRLVRSGKFGLIVVDSVAALVPKAELEGDMGQAHMGLQARLMSQALRKLTGIANQSATTIIFINQYRMRLNVTFGDPRTPAGGGALMYYASQRIEMARSSTVKDSTTGEATSNVIRVKCIKNKLAPPYRECEVDLEFGRGIVHEAEVFDLAVEQEIIDKSGSWYSYNAERLGQGRAQCIKLLEARQELTSELEIKVRANLFGGK